MPHRNPSVPPTLLPQDDIDLYAAALQISATPHKAPIHDKLLNFLYYGILIAVFAWMAAMAFDRAVPIHFTVREILNPDHQVAPGERIQVRAVRSRSRLCELTKRHAVVDGIGRRHEFDAERWDAYGPVTLKPEADITGPILPLDASPGRGRLITAFAWDCNMLQKATGWSITEVRVLEFDIVPRRQ